MCLLQVNLNSLAVPGVFFPSTLACCTSTYSESDEDLGSLLEELYLLLGEALLEGGVYRFLPASWRYWQLWPHPPSSLCRPWHQGCLTSWGSPPWLCRGSPPPTHWRVVPQLPQTLLRSSACCLRGSTRYGESSTP